LLVSVLANLWDRSRFFSAAVSSERMTWIKEMRGLSARLLSLCERYTPENLPDDKDLRNKSPCRERHHDK
ncbi:MAG: hypothetical protein IJT94_12110, partial [Oscillibacter sp.]|nr:hypothetical protein [Oscillibacter sp.]